MGTTMTATAILLLAATALAGSNVDRPPFLVVGRDPAPGLLVNLSAGARPFDPPDPSRPTLIFVQGVNPASFVVHLTMAEQFAAAVALREAGRCNVLAWKWNIISPHPRVNREWAVTQGGRLAAAMIGARLTAHRVQIVGQSLGCVIAASATRVLRDTTGARVQRLTLLDPAAFYHDIIFDRMGAGTTAASVEHYWAPGPSGYSRAVHREGVWNFRVDVPSPVIGIVSMPRSAHWRVVHWYIETVENANASGGYNMRPPVR